MTTNFEKNHIDIYFHDDAVIYKSDQDAGAEWLSKPYSFDTDWETVSLLSQLEEEGYAEMKPDDNELCIPWDNLYKICDSNGYQSSLHLLKIPELQQVRPVLSSKQSLADQNFLITIAGWRNPDGTPISGITKTEGAILIYGPKRALLPKDAFDLVRAVAAFHARPILERNAESNRLAWSQIRNSALKANADLSNYLKNTVVITPEKLDLRMRKATFGDSKTVEIIPTFDGATSRWIDIFDRTQEVVDRYDIPDEQGLVHIIISPEVKTVLKEIKKMPGRRVAGERAEAFIRNPFATLGPAAEKTIDPHEFEQARLDAGIAFARFTAHSQYDESGYPSEVFLLVEESFLDEINSTKVPFKDPDSLNRFIAKLEDRINKDAQCCHWEGFDLEILGDTPDQLEILKQASKLLHQRDSFSFAELFDLSRYSERIEGFGVEKRYYSPYIAKQNSDNGWFPDNIEPVLVYTPDNTDTPVVVPFDKESRIDFKNMLQQAMDAGEESFVFRAFPKPFSVKDARDIITLWEEAINDINRGSFEPKAKRESDPVKGLVVKPNILNLDHEENRGSLELSNELKPMLPEALKPGIQLKDHQISGVSWLQQLWRQSPLLCRGAILADDMGLGKTLQLLTFIARCLEDNPTIEPILIVAPVSLLENWKDEINNFFLEGTFPILTLYGGSIADLRLPSEEIDEDLRSVGLKRLLRRDWIGDAKVVLTTYETLRDLEFSLAGQKWSIMVCDEAQKIKNPNALVTRSAKKQNVRFKIACTGTPVENTLVDLWCLFDFIQSGYLGSLNEFGIRYRKPIEAETEDEKKRVDELRDKISNQLMVRKKKDVAKDLPQKIIDDDCRKLTMSLHQRHLYGQAIACFRNRSAESPGTPWTNHLGLLQYLRRICSDPIPIESLSTITEQFASIMDKSPKMSWLIRQLEVIENRGEKAIIFCEFKDLQRKIQRCIMDHFRFSPVIINGDNPSQSRQAHLKTFQEKLGFGIIILSPLAIGFGVNIQAANHVIHFTRSWNPAKEDQATDRAYRIGQTKDVHVYCPVIVSDEFMTFDAKLDTLLDWKRGLSDDVLNGTCDMNASDFADLEDIDGGSAFENDFIDEDDITSMTSDTFRILCAILWSKLGFQKSLKTSLSGNLGVDVIAIQDNEGLLIQCSTSSEDGEQLEWGAIKDVVSGSSFYRERHPGINFVLAAATNNYFDASAKEQASMNNVHLYDRSDIMNMLAKTPIKKIQLESYLLYNPL